MLSCSQREERRCERWLRGGGGGVDKLSNDKACKEAREGVFICLVDRAQRRLRWSAKFKIKLPPAQHRPMNDFKLS